MTKNPTVGCGGMMGVERIQTPRKSTASYTAQMGVIGKLLARLERTSQLSDTCEWVQLDTPRSPKTPCGKPAKVLIRDTRCGHGFAACFPCLVHRAYTTQWWWCPICNTATDVAGKPIQFYGAPAPRVVPRRLRTP